jgi:hypothetical protein
MLFDTVSIRRQLDSDDARSPRTSNSPPISTCVQLCSKDTQAKEVKVRTTIHLALNQLQTIHLPFSLPITPRRLQGGANSSIVLLDSGGEGLQTSNADRRTGFQPRIKVGSLCDEPW